MRKEEIQVFVDGLMHYFNVIGNQAPVISAPFLIDSLAEHISEYTGIIGIAGAHSGNIIFTAPKSMLMQLLSLYSGNEYQAELILDLVGEIANTISGNARESLGPEFVLSPPVVTRGQLEDVRTASGLQTYCIPMLWNSRRANLIVAITESSSN